MANKMQIPLTFFLPVSPTVAESTTAQFNYTRVLFFDCRKPQIVLDSAKTVADSATLLVFGAILNGTVY